MADKLAVKYFPLTPAYGRDYRSKAAAENDFLVAQKDFQVEDPSVRGRYCSVRDFAPGSTVRIFYKSATESVLVTVPETLPEAFEATPSKTQVVHAAIDWNLGLWVEPVLTQADGPKVPPMPDEAKESFHELLNDLYMDYAPAEIQAMIEAATQEWVKFN